MCQDELLSLKETQTYTVVGINEVESQNIVRCHWVFAIKTSADGLIECYKARIVTKGFSQIYQINYDKTFAPVVKWDSIHILLALTAQYDLEVHQMDVKMAFLNSDLDHAIYMEPPPGSANYRSKGVVWKLKKSLYGLKQASRSWYQKAKDEFGCLGFICCDADHSVFIHNG